MASPIFFKGDILFTNIWWFIESELQLSDTFEGIKMIKCYTQFSSNFVNYYTTQLILQR